MNFNSIRSQPIQRPILNEDFIKPQDSIGGINAHHPALIQAVLENDIEKVRTLLQNGENVNCTSNNGGAAGHLLGEYTPILIAVIQNNKELIQTLLIRGADPRIGVYFGKNALQWALELEHYDILLTLTRAGDKLEMDQKFGHLISAVFDSAIGVTLLREAVWGMSCKVYGTSEIFPCDRFHGLFSFRGNFMIPGIIVSTILAHKCLSRAVRDWKKVYSH